MASKTDISNIALYELGLDPITSLTDGTDIANACNALYEETAKEVMTEGAFSSTIKRATLNQTTTTPNFEYSYEFQLPTDPKCLRVLNANTNIEYMVEGDKLVTDNSTIKVRYISHLTNSGDYDEMLKQAITAKLKYRLAKAFNAVNANESKLLYEQYLLIQRKSLAIDGKQGTSRQLKSEDFTRIR